MIVIVVLMVLLLLLYSRWKGFQKWRDEGVPGPSPNFLFGNGIELKENGWSKTFIAWKEKYGPIVGFYIGGHPQLLITDSQLARKILIKDFNSFPARNEVIMGGVHPQSGLRKQIVWLRGDEWRHMRASLSPVFTSAKLRLLEPSSHAAAQHMTTKLSSTKSGEEANVSALLRETLFKFSLKSTLDLDTEDLDRKAMEAYEAIAQPNLEESKLAILMMLFPGLEPFLYVIRKTYEEIRFRLGWSLFGYAWKFAENLVAVRRKTGTKMPHMMTILMGTYKSHDKLSNQELETTMTREVKSTVSKEKLSDADIICSTMMFILGSFETTNSAFQFVIHNLIDNQEVQDQLRHELFALNREDKNAPYTAKELERIPLLTAIIKESIRMYPPVSTPVSREAMTDYRLENLLIKKGTGVFIGVQAIHMNPDLWPEPEKFDPSRFIASEYDKSSYLAFGAGPKNCIGMRLAYNSMMIITAETIRRFKLIGGPSTAKGFLDTIENYLTVVPTKDIRCKVVPIEQ